MKNKLIYLGLFCSLSLNLHALDNNRNIEFVVPITPPKIKQIDTVLLLKQYIYDLKELNEILKVLYNNRNFKFASETAELRIKNSKSYYTVEYIENLLKVLNGVDPYNDFHILTGEGYIKYIEDIYGENYKMYENKRLNDLIIRDFSFRKKDIKENLKLLSLNLKREDNIKPYLRKIMKDLIIALEQIKAESEKLRKLNIIKPFNKFIDYKYKMPTNWAQYNTTLIDILKFILYGSHKDGYYGIKDYYNKFYFDDLKGFKIIQ